MWLPSACRKRHRALGDLQYFAATCTSQSATSMGYSPNSHRSIVDRILCPQAVSYLLRPLVVCPSLVQGGCLQRHSHPDGGSGVERASRSTGGAAFQEPTSGFVNLHSRRSGFMRHGQCRNERPHGFRASGQDDTRRVFSWVSVARPGRRRGKLQSFGS